MQQESHSLRRTCGDDHVRIDEFNDLDALPPSATRMRSSRVRSVASTTAWIAGSFGWHTIDSSRSLVPAPVSCVDLGGPAAAQSFVISTRDQLRSGSNVFISGAISPVFGPRWQHRGQRYVPSEGAAEVEDQMFSGQSCAAATAGRHPTLNVRQESIAASSRCLRSVHLQHRLANNRRYALVPKC